ncbi:phosphoesterase [Loigolactobacillus backii]|uniref:metallophosphoesterase n=1 Tax=Loigolactobacillus backii TaxID=375175 RepID=UPI0007F13B1D|nr:metallophosphoesterase [Loigolactobacillus backii]ANK59011.1 phosphoesterase [Loigolactobacillus backii]ANK63999.1 phosphoesterase [Loigolactobacillus backii]ANK66448.1 phosphoesterase [Loigolactobacillus backii]OLF69834.1 phosphoesterase [Loigolactobacillus backii]PIO88360.1 phosphoesterase [Loigolactobacillus backii]
MRKIALTSDNHFDVNKLDTTAIRAQQVDYLLANDYDDYLIAGDLFNDFQESLLFVEKLATEMAGKCRVFFIAGNHDMVRGVTFAELQSDLSPNYVHQKTITFPGTNYVLIGNNGWYDYSFADQAVGESQAAFEKWKRAYWIDGVIEQPISDPERMQLVLNQTHQDLEKARQQRKQVLYMTHFVPRRDYISYQTTSRIWRMANAVMGSWHLGALLEAYQVETVLFGHTHTKFQPRQFGQTTYLCKPVGYGLKRLNEWKSSSNFMGEWRACLQTKYLATATKK